MSEPTPDVLKRKEVIDIRMKEYDTLRAELHSRANNLYALGSVGAVLLTYTLKEQMGLKLFVGLGLVFIPFGIACVLIGINMRQCSKRIAQIERAVNRLAGAELLRWEGHWSWAAQGPLSLNEPPDPTDLSLPPAGKDTASAGQVGASSNGG